MIRVVISKIEPAHLELLRGRAVFAGKNTLTFRSREDLVVAAPSPPEGAPEKIKQENRPAPTIAQALTATVAVLTGRKVSLEVVEQRAAICSTCEFVRQDETGKLWCSLCGCGTSMQHKQILNLAAYEERLPKWGCKHPKRRRGQGWPR